MQNEKQEIVFDNWEELLVVMIRGRCFKHNDIRYHYQADEPKGFHWYQEEKDGEPYEDYGIIGDMDAVSKLLVGSTLIEVDPRYIPVDTLMLVSDDPRAFSTDSTYSNVVPRKRYFSHWDRGRACTFIDGATSLTADGTVTWNHWKVAPGGK